MEPKSLGLRQGRKRPWRLLFLQLSQQLGDGRIQVPCPAPRLGGGHSEGSEGHTERPRVDHVSALKDHIADGTLLGKLSALQGSVPDLEVTIEDTVSQGDKVAVRFALASQRTGNDRASAPGIIIYRVAENKIVEHWLQPGVPALLQMLGAIPTPALA